MKKEKIWTLKKADDEFSKHIRKRGKCVRCGKTEHLQCSHFWIRQHYSTRFDVDNADCVCAGCHYFKWEKEKQGEYRDYMLKKLGAKKYEALKAKHYKSVKRREAILGVMEFLGAIKNGL